MAKNQKKENKITFKKSLYDLDSVKEALKDFEKVCENSITNKKKCIEVTLKAKNKGLENNLNNEFCNYVLGLMKNKALV